MLRCIPFPLRLLTLLSPQPRVALYFGASLPPRGYYRRQDALRCQLRPYDDARAGDPNVGTGAPELKRTLGQFQVFAISFAFISVAVGIFATYDELLNTAGPVDILLWVLAAVGQTPVALVVAQ